MQPEDPPAGEPDPDEDIEIVATVPSDDEDADEPIDVPGNAPGETEPGTPDVPANPDPEPPSDPPADEAAPRTTLDLSQLVSSFNAGDWQRADEETYRLLLEAADADESGWLSVREVEAMSCTDLRAIDREWVEASDGKFGFSVQARIWQEVGSPTEYNEQWEEFGDRVGWRVDNRWIGFNEVTFDTSSPEGHLPGAGFGGFEVLWSLGVLDGMDGWGSLFRCAL
ncbi:MAG: GUN4 domain-containing protein [Elainellaceae cyanobacterium]